MKSNVPLRINQLWLKLIFFLFLGLAACSSRTNEATVNTSNADAKTELELVGAANLAAHTTEADIAPAAKIIRKATVKMQVADFRESLTAIENTVKSYQAYISASNETHSDERLENTLTIRVPSASLDLLLNRITSHGIYLDYKNISSEDVSTEFIDISARIKAKKVVEERYLSFLKEAKNIKEILELENEIRKIREEIEATQARINFINSQTAYSTINLEVYQLTSGTSPTSNTYWIRVVNALGAGWEMLASLFIGLLYIWPLLLAIPIFTYFSHRFLHKYPPVK